MRIIANPSALIAADIATTHAIERKGPGEGQAQTMAEGAQILLPPRQAAETTLRAKTLGPAHLRQPDAAWIGCDGSYGVTRGHWTGGESGGWYATVWQRQRKKGNYLWSLTLEAPAALRGEADEFLIGLVADCPARPDPAGDGGPVAAGGPPPAKPDKNAPPVQRPLAGPLPPSDAPAGSDMVQGQSNDGTLAWRAAVLPDGARAFRAWLWKDGKMSEIVHLDAPAPSVDAKPHVTVGG